MPRGTAKDSPQKAAGTGGAAPTRRGRPPKLGKSKITVPIVATGKGRGRPKKAPKSDDDPQEQRTGAASGPKSKARKKSKVGRPRKDHHLDNGSDDDRSDVDKQDDEERRPVGRPNTGAISLNIVRTGRGQGRPKKGSKRAASKSSNGTPKKIGRPSLGGVPYVPTGKPRGRPKTAGKAQEPQKLLNAVELGASSKDPGKSESNVSLDKTRGGSKIHAGADLSDESVTDVENADGYSTSTNDKPADCTADSKDGQADISSN